MFLAFFFGFLFATNLWLFKHNPGLLQERMRLGQGYTATLVATTTLISRYSLYYWKKRGAVGPIGPIAGSTTVPSAC